MHDPELLKLRLLRLDEKIVALLAERLAAARWLLEAESGGEHRESLDPSTISVLLAERAREHGLDPLIVRSVYDALLAPIGGGRLNDGAVPQPPPEGGAAAPREDPPRPLEDRAESGLPAVQPAADGQPPPGDADGSLTDLLPSASASSQGDGDGPDSLMQRLNAL